VRALVYVGGGEVRIEELGYLSIPRGHVLVRVKAFGVGDFDIAVYRGVLKPSKLPIVLGREFVGVIEEVGGGVRRDVIGLRVAVEPLVGCGLCSECRGGVRERCPSAKMVGIDVDGGMADRAVVPHENIVVVPMDLRVEEGVFIEPISRILKAFERVGFLLGKVVVSLGLTPMSILASRIAEAFGARALLVSDVKVGGVESVGVADCVDYIKSITDGKGADVVLLYSEEFAEIAPELARPGGVLALTSPLSRIPVERLVLKEISVFTVGTAPRETMRRAVDLIRLGRVHVRDLLNYGEFSPNVFETAIANKALKTIVRL